MSVLSAHYQKLIDQEGDKILDNNGDEFITLKRIDHELPEELKNEGHQPISKRKLLKATSKKKWAKDVAKGEKLIFDDEGNPHQIYELQDETDFFAAGTPVLQKQAFLQRELSSMNQEDMIDKMTAKEKRQQKKLKYKEKLKAALEEKNPGPIVTLAISEEGDNEMSLDENYPTSEAIKNDRTKRKDEFSDETEESERSEKDKVEPKKHKNKRPKVLETEEPETLEEQEALALRLLNGF